jgi:hypothetical protein
MPALAVLLALHWPRLRRAVVTSTLVLAGLLLAAMAVLSFALKGQLPSPEPYGSGHWALLLLTTAALVFGFLRPARDPAAVLATAFLIFLSFSSLLGPLDGPLGRYDETAQRSVEGRDVWVPVDFIAKEEGYRFLLPGARVHAYREERDASVEDVLEHHSLAVVRLRPGHALGETTHIIGERLDLRGRHSGAEIRAMLSGQVFEHLFVREVLVERPGGSGL